MNDEILTIKKENVLRAAEECSEAKRILAKVFPDAFEKEKEWKKIEWLGNNLKAWCAADKLFINVRGSMAAPISIRLKDVEIKNEDPNSPIKFKMFSDGIMYQD